MLRMPVVLALALAGCSEDGPTQASFAEHCGVAAPVRLLELRPDQAHQSTRRHGDRLYHALYRRTADGKPRDRVFRPDPTRLLTSVDIDDESNTSTLLLVDGDTRSEQRVDDHVLAWSPDIRDGDFTLMTYIVHNNDRSGIWQVRLAPVP